MDMKDLQGIIQELRLKVVNNKYLSLIMLFALLINLPSLFWGFGSSGPSLYNVRYSDEGIFINVFNSMVVNYGNPNTFSWPHLFYFIDFGAFILPKLLFFSENPVIILNLFLRTTSLIFFLWTLSIIYKIGYLFPAPNLTKDHRYKIGLASAFFASVLPITVF